MPSPREIRVRHRREAMLGDGPFQTARRSDRFSRLQIVDALLPIRHGFGAGLGWPEPTGQRQHSDHARRDRSNAQQPAMPPTDQLPPQSSARARLQMREHFPHIRKAPARFGRHALQDRGGPGTPQRGR